MNTHARHSAFTLIEMLVVVVIITGMVALSLPMMGAMQRDTGRAVGINTVGIAATTARAFATRPKQFALDAINPNGDPAVDAQTPDPVQYSGVAALFTPSGEVRIVENDVTARSREQRIFPQPVINNAPLERLTQDATITPGPDVLPRHLNGFKDLGTGQTALDFIEMPATAGVAGVTRTDNGNEPTLLPPPFAVWFSATGQLVVSPAPVDTGAQANRDMFVYYDGDHDGFYEIDLDRIAYDPAVYDRSQPEYNRGVTWDSSEFKHKLPFEKIESVAGVYVYDKAQFKQAAEADGFTWTDTGSAANNARYDWMKKNATLVVFNAQTGATVRTLTDRQ